MFVFSDRLKELRDKANMTQEELAKKLELKPGAVSKYECDLAYPTFEGLQKMSKIFNVSVDYLCGTEKPSDVSAFGLSVEQRELLAELANLFREHNKFSRKKLSSEQYELIGKIVDNFRT